MMVALVKGHDGVVRFSTNEMMAVSPPRSSTKVHRVVQAEKTLSDTMSVHPILPVVASSLSLYAREDTLKRLIKKTRC